MGWRILRGAIILLLSMAAGFAFGRFGLGEGYLKRSVASIQEQPEPKPIHQPSLPPERVPEVIPDIPAIVVDETEPSSEEENGESPSERPEEEATETMPPQGAQDDTSSGQISLQVGSFDRKESAYQQAEALTNLGYPARVVPGTVGSKVVYRVLVGSYATEDNARAVAEQLKQKGIEAFISR
ncbi:MAG: hypothetical protein GTO55_04775 [Armatimonadetes bacterium]|nr:hypothetical protein [Armatimonadota bacterium]NIM23580.1 hypothetical protein [Armatimonadota bacterium]NIM67446.1 hypothetical protein [Armatimonadota bacterium]NIM75947.1 hypothetical protein [Armatimonadota bacterium]NIN05632.1 hypothetical protein [Armatimonadota bacterium]